MASRGGSLRVTVVAAGADQVRMVELDVASGTTLLQAVEQSRLADGEAPLSRLKAGIFGEVRPLDARLRDGDRVEIYRDLQIGPKEARRARERRKKR
jgi:uncharacterized protein